MPISVIDVLVKWASPNLSGKFVKKIGTNLRLKTNFLTVF